MANAETDLQRRIQMEATRMGARLFRNQVGRYLLADGRWLQSGLAVGSSDLIGWVTRPDGVAQFLSVEVKTRTGRTTDEQEAWLSAVRSAGGISLVARDPADLGRIIRP